MNKLTKEKMGYRLYGMPWQLFGIFSVIVLAASYMGCLPSGLVGAVPIMIVLGTIINEIGDNLPIVNKYLGGGAIVVIFGTAAMNTYGLINESTVTIVSDFMKSGTFLDFYIAALITGSILGMNRQLLIKSAVRYLPAIIGSVAAALGLVALVGALTGYGAVEAVLYIAIPIMGGGMGAGAVPLSKIFGESLGSDPEAALSLMIPAVALGNALAIVCGGLLDRLGKLKPNLTGNGNILANKSSGDINVTDSPEYIKARDSISLQKIGMGLFISTAMFTLGSILGKLLPSIHGYAWMIMSVALVKGLGLLPEEFEIACFQWYRFVMSNLTSALLVGIGFVYTDLQQIIESFSIEYLVLVSATLIGAMIGGALVGKLVGFYPIESSITSALCMANMGGTGDVAVLSAAKRMDLMPFAQISSRIGGAFMLILSSIILQFIG